MFGYRNSDKKLGELLLTNNVINQQELDSALSVQEEIGSRLGQVLEADGKISAFALHKLLAEQYEMPFADLTVEGCDPLLLEKEERHIYLDLQVVPWRRADDRSVVLATTGVNDKVEAWAASKYQKYQFVITSPYDVLWTVQKHFDKYNDKEAREQLWRHNPQLSARKLFISPIWTIISLLVMVTLSATFFQEYILWGVLVLLNVFYASTLLFKLAFFATGHMAERRRIQRESGVAESLLYQGKDKDLPVYTLLVPLYKEKSETIQSLISAVRKFDYPKSKLDVKLIVEADDEDTISIIKNLACESYFEIIRVPFSLPRTKPKACNYALKFARGEYVTIYDAEDKPDPLQLRKVLGAFQRAAAGTVCVQSRLNYFNWSENLLTRMFAMEYSTWFNRMLPGLEAMRMPIPLGGTSNHFPLAVLRELMAWDPYNVTEDADLGVRLAQKGYKTTVIDSLTLEEAPVSVGSWIKQRTRWIKGYMQTYIVHMRSPLELYRALGIKGFLGFLFFVGAPALVFMTLPVSVALSIYAISSDALSPLPQPLLWFSGINLLASVVLHIIMALMVVRIETKWSGMAKYTLFFPVYWVLHALASYRALWQLITRPHYWDKTEHGVTRVVQAEDA